ncbi:MAG: hypothetical protein EOO62_03705 [Hymenobacter sp.]|nr:MAG: hypothetical protein EOO62_03705 [Hymenobacter sp.]
MIIQTIRLLLLFLMAATSHQLLAQPIAWQKTPLDSVASVTFPGVASKKDDHGRPLYLCSDSTSIYMVSIQRTKSQKEVEGEQLEAFYKGVLLGVLKTTGGGEVLHKSSFVVAGFSGIEAQFTTPDKPELPANKFMRVLAVNGTIYVLSFWTDADPVSTAADRDKFFSSLQLNVTKRAAADHSTAYEIGRQTGRVAFLCCYLVVPCCSYGG